MVSLASQKGGNIWHSIQVNLQQQKSKQLINYLKKNHCIFNNVTYLLYSYNHNKKLNNHVFSTFLLKMCLMPWVIKENKIN